MNYNQNLLLIKTYFPEIDFISEDDFSLFDNEKFAKKVFNYLCECVDNINDKLKLNIHFAFRFNRTFNATAYSKDDVNIIMINHGLINQIEPIIEKSLEVFLKEGFTVSSGFPINKDILTELFIYLISSYLFYHELGHIIQFNFSNKENVATFNEEYSSSETYREKNHVYEVDADLFGVSLGSFLILQYMEDNNIKVNLAILFNLVTLYVLIVANIFISFSGKATTIYYYKGDYPHPIIRTRFCIDQILHITNENIELGEEYVNMIDRRCLSLLNQMLQDGILELDYMTILDDNLDQIIEYMDTIDEKNNSYPELARYRAQQIYDLIGI
ncbi:hypothetical protein Flavo103_36740 [Flavobacterium collinsii]|uniref:hypothetical protein n=1 Tax=Flavobacterium collinsii TaxID=1114861 RepID=UPI0022C67842|nr:hypothetical protein [Flavobacterium collinsii]GIQ60538.1 hypothetical protein Flavo103_36740 [Flavobacterium collinsii]